MFFATLLTLVSTAGAQDPSQALLQEGMAYLDALDYHSAAECFEQSYNWEPNFDAAFQAGYCHFKLKKFAEAELWLSKAAVLNPSSEQATLYLASAAIADYRTSRAIGLLEDFIRMHPGAHQVSAMLSAIRSDMNPRKIAPRSVSVLQVVAGTVLLLALLAYLASLRAHDAGIGEAGRGAGLAALTSLYLLSPFPPLLGVGGYAWAGYKLRRGYRLYRYLGNRGAWANGLQSQLYRFAAAFVAAGGAVNDARTVELSLDGYQPQQVSLRPDRATLAIELVPVVAPPKKPPPRTGKREGMDIRTER